MTAQTTLTVALGARAYDIVIGNGVLADAPGLLAPVLARPRVFVVTDETVAGLHLGALALALDRGGIRHDAVVLPPGEQTKSFAHLEALLDRLLGLGVERDDVIVAVGGGVIGDLAGFAASVLRRGTRFVQVPTTLLAQVDSSVGGKTGIDTHRGKNLVGAFHQPSLVLADTGALATLPPRELRAGYAEVVKYGLLGDSAFFAWLEAHGPDVLAGRGAARDRAVRESCAAKARIVARDETDRGERALLNLGHTFGHALEAANGYDGRLLHGEAVAIGMTMAFDLSARLGLCPPSDAERVRSHLHATGLPVHPRDLDLPEQDADVLVGHMAQDKKVSDGRPTFILARAVGEAFLSRDVAFDEVRAFLAETLD